MSAHKTSDITQVNIMRMTKSALLVTLIQKNPVVTPERSLTGFFFSNYLFKVEKGCGILHYAFKFRNMFFLEPHTFEHICLCQGMKVRTYI